MNQVDKEKWRRLVPALIILAGGYAGYHWLSEAPAVTPTPSVAVVTAPAKQPQTSALIELGKRVGATWAASQPQGWLTVAADEDGRTDRLALKINYANSPIDLRTAETDQRALVRAVLAQIAAEQSAKPHMVFVSSASATVGETGKPLFYYLGDSTWDEYSDSIKYRQP